MLHKTINGYTIRRLLGEGGMAEVWYAENNIGNPAAIKFLKKKFCEDEVVTKRFENEARVMVRLDHPNIRQVYDYTQVDGRPCIVMEYLDGADLKATIRTQGRVDSETAARYWDAIVSALNYTHKQDIIHRDIKPSNIFVTADGHIKLLDFGIAKVRDAVSGTQTGQKLGTLVYMSPEQITDSKHVDARTDLYSLAVTFVHLLSGRIPYNAESSSEYAIMNQIVQEPVDLTGVPADWQTFLRPYLAKEPGKRPGLQTFSSQPVPGAKVDDHTFVEQATSRVTSNPEPEQTAVDSPRNPRKADPQRPVSNSRNRLPWILGGAAAAVLLAVLLALLLGRGGTKENQETEVTAVVDSNTPDAEEASSIDGAAEREQAEREAAAKEQAEKEAAAAREKQEKEAADAREKQEKEAKAKRKADLERQGYVDLGLASGTMWRNSNESGTYDFNAAKSRFGSKLPKKAQWEELQRCTWKWTGSGYRVTGTNGNSIYFPAEGCLIEGVVDSKGAGVYWSSSSITYPNNSMYAYSFYFDEYYIQFSESPIHQAFRAHVRLVQKQ